MKALDRSAVTINFTQAFADWYNALEGSLQMYPNMLGESKTYLLPSNYDDAGKFIKKHYKQIFEAELEDINMEFDDLPFPVTFALFEQWFTYEISDWVIDLIDHKPMRS